MKNKKLTYKKYKGCRDIITINLYNNYTLIALKSYDNKKNTYSVEFMLKENTVKKWDLIEKASLNNIESKNINNDILIYATSLLSDNFFDYYIERYEYELKCFDMGNELIEKERYK